MILCYTDVLAGQDLFDNILASCYQAGFSPKIVQEAPRLTSSLNLIAADWFIHRA